MKASISMTLEKHHSWSCDLVNNCCLQLDHQFLRKQLLPALVGNDLFTMFIKKPRSNHSIFTTKYNCRNFCALIGQKSRQ